MYSLPYVQLYDYYNAEIVGWSPSFNNDEFMSVITYLLRCNNDCYKIRNTRPNTTSGVP